MPGVKEKRLSEAFAPVQLPVKTLEPSEVSSAFEATAGTAWAQKKSNSTKQVESQPSPEIVLLSSHSSPKSTRPLPQTSSKQPPEQPSPLTTSPSSHSSPIPNCGI